MHILHVSNTLYTGSFFKTQPHISKIGWNEQTILDRVYPSQDMTGMDKVGVLDGDPLI